MSRNGITKEIVRKRFERTAEAMRWHTETYKDGQAVIGATFLEHSSPGGWCVSRMVNTGGGQSSVTPGWTRYNNYEMLAWLDGMLAAHAELKPAA